MKGKVRQLEIKLLDIEHIQNTKLLDMAHGKVYSELLDRQSRHVILSHLIFLNPPIHLVKLEIHILLRINLAS